MSPFFLVVSTLLYIQSYASQICERRTRLLARASSSECDLYVVSGQDNLFENYAFSDFRNLSNYSINWPSSITAEEDQGGENITSAYFAHPPFSDHWEIRRGIRNAESDVPMIYSAQNVYISQDPSSDGSQTYLTLRTTRLQDFQSVVQLVSRPDNLLHASMRTRMKIISDGKDGDNVAGGAVVGFFTYESDTQESDIEVLTKHPSDIVELSTQPASSTTPGADASVTIPNGKDWTEWVEYRMDWFAGRNIWYLDEEMMLNSTDSVPTEPSQLMLNLWSNGQSFSGRMRPGREVYVAVQWIEIAYNVSNQGQSLNQTDGLTQCLVDSVETKGIPEVIQNSSVTQSAVSTALKMFGTIVLVLIAWYCT
ncbi:uncharacterized protein A1O9_03604 [Exophiala aquamarina CBS 119918]|uniref:GH16 domain-containing protein n=1 Tax=Exophiala aquamarina CBS 119918 TaxID=1182545 RepID=A0A072PG19_9EURO|nr:uncharacterized protein A1O9_03604 [Exophiala aquamarina CBS 119918]KEF58761.1 hypothetical protein A1O9_03604 [Exophiala aquamarina CBS 119918]